MIKNSEVQDDVLLWESLEKQKGILKYEEIDNEVLTDYQKNLLNLFERKASEMIQIEEGKIVEGTIKYLNRKEVVIDINYKDYVYIENDSADWRFVKNLKEGDTIKVLISKIAYKPSYKIIGSISELIRMDVENRMGEFFQEKTPIDAKIVDKNTAGFMLKLDINGIDMDAFMPNTIAAPNKLTAEQAEAMLGKQVKVCLETFKEDKGLLVVSRKKYLKEHVFPKEVELLQKGEILYEGYVTGTAPFGVFVEFGQSLTGMIHKVNLNPKYNIRDIKPGMTINFYVKDILKKGKEIICTQVLRESLWDKLKVGQTYEGTVINNKNFGSLIKLDEETFGVIQSTYIKRAERKLDVGEKVKVKVISFIKDDRKIYLNFA
jgi:ribosomal protein S1